MTALDTGTEDLLAEVDDGIAVITMNRPSRRNAFSNDSVSDPISRWLRGCSKALHRRRWCGAEFAWRHIFTPREQSAATSAL